MENSTMRKGPEQWFLDAHPERGSVRVQVSTGRGLFPVEGARVEIYRRLGPEPTVFYEGVTDASGIAEDIRLPALPAGWSQSAETAGISGTVYQVSARHPHDAERRRRMSLIEEGQGFASIGDNVEFCVSGFDRWLVYNGRCRILR